MLRHHKDREHAAARLIGSKQHSSLGPTERVFLCGPANIKDQEECINETYVISNTPKLQKDAKLYFSWSGTFPKK